MVKEYDKFVVERFSVLPKISENIRRTAKLDVMFSLCAKLNSLYVEF